MLSSPFFLSLLALPLSHAASISRLVAKQAITTLTTTQIDVYTPYTYYASTGYCTAASTKAWTCGANCEANPTFIPTASGGDGDDTQYWFVGYDPTLKTVIVSHQGTNTSEILPIIEDVDATFSNFESSLFPGLSSSIEGHSGFLSSQAKTATSVLSAVQTAISKHSATTVTVVGHSLGAAIALVDLVYLHIQLPSSIKVQFKGYGLPRVGNQAFATYVDTTFPNLVEHVNNKEDPVPILPGMFLGYVHPAGEVHIQDSGSWDACPGEDNPSTLCIVGDVPTIFEGDESDHDGPYNGVEMGC